MKNPINTDSVSDILDIVEEETDSSLPRDEIKERIRERNMQFFEDASKDEIDREILMRVMTLRKLSEMTSRREVSDELDSVEHLLE